MRRLVLKNSYTSKLDFFKDIFSDLFIQMPDNQVLDKTFG